MNKNLPLLFIFLLFSGFSLSAQSCPNNLVSNPAFRAGITGGWSVMSQPSVWLKMNGTNCIDTFVMLGSSTTSYAAIEQNIAFTPSTCYDFCICMESDQFSRARIFAATADTSVNVRNLAAYNYSSNNVYVIDSFDVHGQGVNYCKRGFTLSRNYTRLIIMNTVQPTYFGAELHIDNVCLKACTGTAISETGKDEFFISYSDDKVTIQVAGGYFRAGIIDLNGRIVESFEAEGNYELNTSAFSHGIYFLMITKGDKVFCSKLIL